LSVGQQAPAPTSPPATRNQPSESEDEIAGEKPWDDVEAGTKKFWDDRTRRGPVPANAYMKAKQQREKVRKSGGAVGGKVVSSLNGVVWRPLGPGAESGGRASEIYCSSTAVAELPTGNRSPEHTPRTRRFLKNKRGYLVPGGGFC
jgi:hypothetical protein